MPAATFLEKLSENNMLAVQFGKQTIRLVTHLDFNDEMLMEVEKIFKKIWRYKKENLTNHEDCEAFNRVEEAVFKINI